MYNETRTTHAQTAAKSGKTGKQEGKAARMETRREGSKMEAHGDRVKGGWAGGAFDEQQRQQLRASEREQKESEIQEQASESRRDQTSKANLDSYDWCSRLKDRKM